MDTKFVILVDKTTLRRFCLIKSRRIFRTEFKRKVVEGILAAIELEVSKDDLDILIKFVQ